MLYLFPDQGGCCHRSGRDAGFNGAFLLLAYHTEVADELPEGVALDVFEAVAGADELLDNSEPIDLSRLAVHISFGSVWIKKSAFTSMTSMTASTKATNGMPSTSACVNARGA